MYFSSKWPSKRFFGRPLKNLSSQVHDDTREQEPSYTLFENEPEMTNANEAAKKKGFVNTIRGYFKRNKSRSSSKDCKAPGTSTETVVSTPVYDDYDINPALDPVHKCGTTTSNPPLCVSASIPSFSHLEEERVYPDDTPEYVNLGNCKLKSILTDFETRTLDDEPGYVNFGFIGKTTTQPRNSANSKDLTTPRPQLTRQNAVVVDVPLDIPSQVPFDIQWEQVVQMKNNKKNDLSGDKC